MEYSAIPLPPSATRHCPAALLFLYRVGIGCPEDRGWSMAMVTYTVTAFVTYFVME